MDAKKFITICKKSQKELKKYLAKELGKVYSNVVNENGFIYAQGNFPVLLVAHMDTVHKDLVHQVVYDKNLGTISSPQGIGGDDRCGIYMILEVIKKFNCSVLFTEDEEIGGVGAEKFVKSKISKPLCFNYMIEFDRRGANDAVFYDCANPEFEEFITREFYQTNFGSFSDISFVAPALGCAAVNLSCGYYNAHTTAEYVVLKEMQDSIDAACKILERTTEKEVFEYLEDEEYASDSYYWGFSGKANEYYIWYFDENENEAYYCVEAVSKEEAVGKFLMTFQDFTYSDIYDVFSEEEVSISK